MSEGFNKTVVYWKKQKLKMITVPFRKSLIPYMYKWDFANNSYAKSTLEI